MRKEQPIGIFDSGIGGLTVASAVSKLLPMEQIIYFGDIAHLPYGDKSTAAIQAYAIKICDFLLQKNCKVILIACNSASAAAYELAKEYTGSKAKVINVIDPAVDLIADNYKGKKVGLIGTRQTVGSKVYESKLKLKDPSIKLQSLATPLLAPMIEEKFHLNRISHEIIQQYLSHSTLAGIEALILGCTHYPVIKSSIQSFCTSKVSIIDSAVIVAQRLKNYLNTTDLFAEKRASDDRFFVSDFTPAFEAATELFFNKNVPLEKHILWE